MRSVGLRGEATDDDEDDRIDDHAAEADVEEGLELAGAGDERAVSAEEESPKGWKEEDDDHAGDQSRHRPDLSTPAKEEEVDGDGKELRRECHGEEEEGRDGIEEVCPGSPVGDSRCHQSGDHDDGPSKPGPFPLSGFRAELMVNIACGHGGEGVEVRIGRGHGGCHDCHEDQGNEDDAHYTEEFGEEVKNDSYDNLIWVAEAFGQRAVGQHRVEGPTTEADKEDAEDEANG